MRKKYLSKFKIISKIENVLSVTEKGTWINIKNRLKKKKKKRLDTTIEKNILENNKNIICSQYKQQIIKIKINVTNKISSKWISIFC